MFTLNCKGRLLVIDEPIVMGIINVTPDSFYTGSRQSGIDAVLKQADKMLTEGAMILDIGGQSTRPGSEAIGVVTELQRVIPAIEAVAAGACIVNDVSSGEMDFQMIETVASLRVPYITMHMKGTPATMQQHARYENVTREVLDFFIRKTEQCRLAGINDVIIDPGFGFAKTIQHNFKLLKDLGAFKMLQKPVLAGLSRKATIYKTLGTSADEALNGTTVLNTIALLNGANILRVHDVKEAKEAVKLIGAYSK